MSFKFGPQITGQYISSIPRGGTVKQLATANCGFGPGGFGGLPLNSASGGDGGFAGGGGGGAGGHRTQMYNSVSDRLDEPSIIDDWIPRHASGIHRMYRNLYLRDITGAAIDIISNLPFGSDWVLTGIEDKSILKFYQSALETFDPANTLPEITCEFLVIGRQCISGIFDEQLGYWKDYIYHDPDFLRITPIPVKNYLPKIDVAPSPGMQMFLNSKDKRDLEALSTLPRDLVIRLRRGQYFPLEPLNTFLITRRVNPYDTIGTSFMTRVVPFWALEKALMNATVTGVRRKARNIVHVTCGDEGWEPETVELESIADLFMRAEMDPVGGYVVTRRGITATPIEAGGLWKWSDEWEFLHQGKMRACGINDALLSGDATLNTLEAAMSTFVENVKALRDKITKQLIIEQMFVRLARLHGFVKRKRADLDHAVRTTTVEKTVLPNASKQYSKESVEKMMKVPQNELLIPDLRWNKQLGPEADVQYLEVLEKLEAKGVPVSTRTWSAAGGLSLEKMLQDMPEDRKIRKIVKQFRMETGPNSPQAFASTAIGRLENVPVWDQEENFLQLPFVEAVSAVELLTSPENIRKLESPREVLHTLHEHFDNNRKVDLAAYLFTRIGLCTCNLEPDLASDIASWVTDRVATNARADVQTVRAAVSEISFLSRVVNQSPDPVMHKELASTLNDIQARMPDRLKGSTGKMYSGV